MLIQKKKGQLNNALLTTLAFSVVFYSRIVATTIHLSILNLLHFLIVPAACAIIIFTTPTKNPKQISLSLSFLRGLFILFAATIASAYLNDAGIINAVISFMMLGEPFVFLLAISSIPMSYGGLKKNLNFLYWSVGINFLLAVIQKPLIDMGRISAGGLNGTDGCGGVFFVSGAGNYVSATVSVAFALYFLFTHKGKLWIKIAVLCAALYHVQLSDSKQIVLAYGVAWGLLIVLNSKDIVKTIRLLSAFLLVGFVGVWAVENVEALSAYTSWARPELYGPDGLAWYAKFYAVRSTVDHFISPLNWLLGLGPGHTVSRLGVWFLKDYDSILGPLGSTTTKIGSDARNFVDSFWLTSGSSLFSPIFGWAGIWGDLGFLGLGAYLNLCYLTWKNFGLNDVSKVTLLSIFLMGLIFTQMEEPGYMLSIAFILALSWQENQIVSKSAYSQIYNIKQNLEVRRES